MNGAAVSTSLIARALCYDALRLRKSFLAFWVFIFLPLLGCSSGPEGQNDSPSAGGSSGSAVSTASAKSGAPATGGASASGGIAGSGGHGAGAGTPAGGSGGASSATGGGGIGGIGGGSGSLVGGASNSGGSASASGGSAAVGGSGPAPTFTMIYDTIITPNCGGARCHLKRPTPFGYDFSSKSAASAAWRSDVIAGDGAGSPMFQVLNFAIMPKDKPPLTVEQLYMVLNWIDAGARDD